MIAVIGQYHTGLLQALERLDRPYHLVLDRRRYDREDAVSFTNEATLIDHIGSLQPKVTLAVAMYEQYIPVTAVINEALGTEHALSSEAALNCTDKVRMRHALSAVDGISPAFREVGDDADAYAFVAKYDYPVILKPANLSKSLLVSKCENDEQLNTTLAQMKRDAPGLYERYTVGQRPRFIIEQFMTGSIHTVAAFADRGGRVICAPGVVDNVPASEAGYDDGFIFSRTLPGSLGEDDQAAIFACAEAGVRALGMISTPAHVELFLTSEGPKIIEIGARLGGYRPRMYEQSYGIDLYGCALEALSGKVPVMKQVRPRYCGVFELFPQVIGRYSGIDPFPESGAYEYFAVKPKPGAVIGPAKHGYKATAIAMVSADDQTEFARRTQQVTKLKVQVKPI